MNFSPLYGGDNGERNSDGFMDISKLFATQDAISFGLISFIGL